MSVPYTAGSGVPSITEDGDLLVKGTYAGTEHGQLTRQLVNEGHIWQGSVSYQTHVMDDGRIVRELLNGTFTGVPSNPEAVVLTSKGKKVPPPKDVGDDLLQAVHDAAVALGAQCAPLQQATKSKMCCGRTSRRAAVLAQARARKFQAVQNIGLAVAEAEASAETRWGFTGTAPDSGAAGGVMRGRERVKRFERRNSELMRAQARVRKFALDSRLTEKECLP